MNLVFIIGKIVSEIEFSFVLNSKNISIVHFKIELNNKTIVKVKGYNEVADFCYSKLKKEDNVFICGELNTKGEINVRDLGTFFPSLF